MTHGAARVSDQVMEVPEDPKALTTHMEALESNISECFTQATRIGAAVRRLMNPAPAPVTPQIEKLNKVAQLTRTHEGRVIDANHAVIQLRDALAEIAHDLNRAV